VLWPGGVFQPWAALVVVLALAAQLALRWSVLPLIAAAALIGGLRAGLLAVSG
jgi:hypothetical protein